MLGESEHMSYYGGVQFIIASVLVSNSEFDPSKQAHLTRNKGRTPGSRCRQFYELDANIYDTSVLSLFWLWPVAGAVTQIESSFSYHWANGGGSRCVVLRSWTSMNCNRRFIRSNPPGELLMKPSEIIFEVTEAVEGGYDAKALGYSIFTQGENWADLKEMVKDAVRCHFDDNSVHCAFRYTPWKRCAEARAST